jgi:hypothetical protein
MYLLKIFFLQDNYIINYVFYCLISYFLYKLTIYYYSNNVHAFMINVCKIQIQALIRKIYIFLWLIYDFR